MSATKTCRCPLPPYWAPGSMVGGSATEDAAITRWADEHGAHPYARARSHLLNAVPRALEHVGPDDVRVMIAEVLAGGELAPPTEPA